MVSSPTLDSSAPIYQGQFGEFTITKDDRNGVILYRASLLVAAVCGGVGTLATLFPNVVPFGLLSVLYAGFSVALGVALAMIHIYVKVLHKALQAFWAIGTLVAVILATIAFQNHQSLASYVAQHPTSILGIGFTFVALNGIFFKEAFCFNRLETKFLVAIVPSLLIGHLLGILPVEIEKLLLGAWAVLFTIFALRKCVQNVPDDIGDKSVFEYLEREESQKKEKTHGAAS